MGKWKILIIALLYSFVCANTLLASDNTWTQKADFGGTARYGAVGFAIGSKGYIGMGYDGSLKQDFWEYDPAASTWTQKADLGGTARHGAVGFAIGDKGYIGTGGTGTMSYMKDFWEYDPAANTWTQKADFAGLQRWEAVGFAIGDKGYIGTGGGFAYFKDFWEYDPVTDTWTQKADFAGGERRWFAVGFSIGSKGYIGTGLQTNSTDTATKDFWEYDPSTNMWTQKADFGGTARYGAVGFAIGSKGYIGTGVQTNSTDAATNDFWEYDQADNIWTKKADFGGTTRKEALGFSIGNKGYVGLGGDSSYKKDFWEYTPPPTYITPTDQTNWQAVGPFGDSVRVIMIDPANSQTVYAGTDNGMYKSTNGGASWSAINSGMTDTGVVSLAIDPADNQTIFAGTSGRVYKSTYGGIFKSTNGGASWTAINSGIPNTHFNALAIDPANSQAIYAGTDDGYGVFKSTNGGASWTVANSGITNTRAYSLAIDPSNSQTIYAGTWGGGVYKSTNGGTAWTAVNSGMTNTDVWTIAIDPVSNQTVYAGTSGGVYKSTDGGISWTLANSGITATYITSLAIDPSNSKVVFAGVWGKIFKSTNSGASWTSITTNDRLPDAYIVSIAIDPTNNNTIYVGTNRDCGIYKSINGGISFIKISSGITSSLIWGLAIDPTNSQTVYTVLSAGVFKSDDGGASWAAVNSEGGYSLVIDPNNSQVIYVGNTGGEVTKSTNGGASWVSHKIIDWTAGSDPTLAIDPTNSSIIYAWGAGLGVYKSYDSGLSWRTFSNDLTGKIIDFIAIDPYNSRTIYAAARDNDGKYMFKSTDGGETWAALNLGVWAGASINSLAIDPTNTSIIYAGTTDINPRALKSTNGGLSWSRSDNGLTGYFVFSLAIDPNNNQTIYAGTENGLFKTTNSGASWTEVLNVPYVRALAIDPANSQSVYAAANTGVFKTLFSNDFPIIIGTTKAIFMESTESRFQIFSSGWPAPVFSLSGALPLGLTFDPISGTINGTPASGTTGTYPLTVTATNGIPPDATRGIMLTILPAISLPVTIASPYSGAKLGSLASITGTASGSSLSKVEVQITDGTYYLQSNGSFAMTPAWVTASGTNSWTLNTASVNWREGIAYTISARAISDSTTSTPSSSTFTIMVPSSKTGTIIFLTITPDTIRAGDSATISGLLGKADTTALSGGSVTLIITPPSTTANPNPSPIIMSFTTDSSGAFTSGALSLFAVPGVYMVQARFEGDTTLAASFTSQALGVTPQSGYAIIVTGKASDNSLLDMHTASTGTIHSILVNKRGFLPENIQYLNSTASSAVTKQQIQEAITTWAKDKLIASPAPLYLIMIDHGSQSGFLLDTDTLTPDQLKGYLDTLESDPQVIASGTLTTHNRIIMIGSCYSGIFAKLSKPGRIVITSANTDEQSIAGFSIYNSGSNTTYYGGEYFIDAMFSYLGRGDTLKEAFTQSSNMVELRDPRKVSPGTHAGVYDTLAQHPLMDDNGDTKASYLQDTDGLLAANLHLGVGIRTLGNPADITAVTETATIPATQTNEIPLWLRVNDNSRIAKAWMEIRTPITSVSSNGGSGQVIPRLLTLPLYYDGLQWNGSYNFPNAGKYNILYYTQDNQTNDITPAKNSVVYRQLTNNPAPADFALKSPNDGNGVSGMFTLTWQEVTSPNKITYTLHVSTDQNFTTEVYQEENILQAATYMPRNTLKNPQTGQYYCQNGDSYCYWNVQAIDSYGAMTESDTRSFTIISTNALPGIIQGFVRDATTGVPIAGANVTAGSNQFTTLENGSFIMEVSSGTYTITAAATGYKTKDSFDITITPGQVFDAIMSLEVNTPPSAFNLISPVDEAATDPMFTLAWQESTDIDGLTYTLLVAKDQNFTNIVYREENIPQAATYTPKDALKDPETGQYFCQNGDSYCYWKVQAIDIYGATTESDTRSFTIISTNALPGIIKGIIYSDLDYSRITNASLTATIGGNIVNIPVTNGAFFLAADPGIITIASTSGGYQNVFTSDVNVLAGEITTLNIGMVASSIKGDIDGLNDVTLSDAILALKIISGLSPAGVQANYPSSGADVNGDGKIGMAEVIWILQVLTGIR